MRQAQGLRGYDHLIEDQLWTGYKENGDARESIDRRSDELRVNQRSRKPVVSLSRRNMMVSCRMLSRASLVKIFSNRLLYLPLKFPVPTLKVQPHLLIALREVPDKSQRSLAEQIGVHESYIRKVKGEIDVRTSTHLTPVSTSNAPKLPNRVVGKDVKSYPARREQREKSRQHRFWVSQATEPIKK